MSIVVAPQVRDALARREPVVALESTILCHGIPRPDNAALAIDMESAVRAAGAVPATTAILAGAARVGLTPDELAALAACDNVAKCTARSSSSATAALSGRGRPWHSRVDSSATTPRPSARAEATSGRSSIVTRATRRGRSGSVG